MTHRCHNGLRTAALLGLLTALILLAGWWFGGSGGFLVAVVVALAVNGFSYYHCDRIALRAMGARPVDPGQAPALHAMVADLARTAGQPVPRLYRSPVPQPNAFATGRDPRHAAVCVTDGLLGLLTPRELRGVLAHELAHVYNRDILLSSVAASLGGIVTMLANLAWFLPTGAAEDDEGGPGVLGVLLMLILGPLAATIIQLAISRGREYQADASGVAYTGDPLALASALRKISAGTRALPLVAEGQLASSAHLMIANPFRPGGLAGLFATHPEMSRRIARLEQLAGARLAPH